MRSCLVLLYVCFVMRTINYCCSCSFYTVTLYIELSPIYSMHASALRVCALQSVNNKTTKTIRLARELKSTGRTLSEVVLFSYVVILFRHVEELFRKSATERGHCCSTSDDFSEHVVSTWTLLPNVERLLWACCIDVDAVARRGPSTRRFREFREASTEAAGLSRANTVAGRGHADRTVHRVTCRRTPTKSDFADPRRKHVICR